MTHRTVRLFSATLLAATLAMTGVSVAVAEDPPPDEQVNLRCIYESLIGVPVDDHPDTDTLCFRLARNQNCTGTGESRVCDDETPWPEFTIPPPYENGFRVRTDAQRTQIRAAYIVERSLSTRCDHYTTSDEPTAGAYRMICLSQTVSRAQVIACQAAVTALGYRRVHDIYVDYETFNCPAATGSSSTQSQRQTGDTAHVVADEPETGQQQSDEQQLEDTAQVVVTEVVEPEVVEPETVEPEVVEPETVEPEVVEPETVEPETVGGTVVRYVESSEPQTARSQQSTHSPERLAYAAAQIERITGQTCPVIDGRITCTG